jgi:hypothetical protein
VHGPARVSAESCAVVSLEPHHVFRLRMKRIEDA